MMVKIVGTGEKDDYGAAVRAQHRNPEDNGTGISPFPGGSDA